MNAVSFHHHLSAIETNTSYISSKLSYNQENKNKIIRSRGEVNRSLLTCLKRIVLNCQINLNCCCWTSSYTHLTNHLTVCYLNLNNSLTQLIHSQKNQIKSYCQLLAIKNRDSGQFNRITDNTLKVIKSNIKGEEIKAKEVKGEEVKGEEVKGESIDNIFGFDRDKSYNKTTKKKKIVTSESSESRFTVVVAGSNFISNKRSSYCITQLSSLFKSFVCNLIFRSWSCQRVLLQQRGRTSHQRCPFSSG